MRRALHLAILAFAIYFLPAFPASSQQAPATGSIEGIVIRADTEEPISNALVTLTQISGLAVPPIGTVVQTAEAPAAGAAVAPAGAVGAIASVSTGADGRFVFKDLNPETYRVAATANGFVRQEYGQRVLNGQGRPLFVVAGQSITNASIRMTQAGTITGRMLDENGQPATGAPVQLLRVAYSQQGRGYQSAGAASVDDRGNYRIFGVIPGRYYLMAGTLPAITNLLPRGGLPTGGTRYSLTYYPNVSNLEQAAAIDVKAGTESAVDMPLKKATQLFHVRGRVINPTGAPFPQEMTVMLGYTTLSGSGVANRPNSLDLATGMFDVSSVPPGEFTIVANQSPQLPRGAAGASFADRQAQQAMALAASVPVHVTNADIDGVVLTLTAGVTVQGKLTVEGQPISALPNLAQLRLNVRNRVLVGGVGMPAPSPIAADGSFQVVGLREGDYRAQMSANAPGYHVKSIKYGEEEIAGRTFTFSSAGSGSFEVVLKAGSPTITGTVMDSQSKPVPGILVVFVPAQRERSDLFRGTNTDQAGKFTMTDVALGEYKVFSWEAAEANAHFDPDFLKQYEQFGKAISVTESSNSNVEVKLIPAR